MKTVGIHLEKEGAGAKERDEGGERLNDGKLASRIMAKLWLQRESFVLVG